MNSSTPSSSDFRTPGQFIDALLTARGWTKRVLAVILGVDDSSVNRLVADKRPVDATMAISLEEIFNVPAKEFLDLQQSYDLAIARISARPDPGRATRAQLFGGLPVAEMIKRGWLDAENSRDIPKVEAALAKFFKEESIENIEVLPHAAKKTNTKEEPTPIQLAWLYRVKEIASEMLVPRYTPLLGRQAVGKLSALLSAAEEARKVPRILAESGIRFVIVESLTSAKIDGVCMWLDKYSPVIGMSLRHDRIDNFWFVLRHELEHVLCGHGLHERPQDNIVMLDTELDGERAGTGSTINEEERVANAAAAEFCVPQKKMDAFIARKAPFFAERDLLGFANTLGIHPGLIAGQLQHRTGRYDRFRAHLQKVRSIVAPSAIVDGWGDVAPVGI
ncbi:helix-turn-helix domain-containing protein [Kerstersia sp.]|uniref:helix-turn-helix domain-containing protein n=1 Tax=Kerstersia sp. TaxID=1930783 RepID=UPI003F8FEA7D